MEFRSTGSKCVKSNIFSFRRVALVGAKGNEIILGLVSMESTRRTNTLLTKRSHIQAQC